MVGLAAAMVSFAEGSELMGELAGVRVEAKQVERTAEVLGREIAQDERQVVDPSPPSASTMYLGMDGTGVPVRKEELVDRAGKQPDGSAKTREVKLVTVWSAEGRDADGIPVRDPGSVSYSAAIESAASRDTDDEASEFAQRADREARRRGFDQAGVASFSAMAPPGSGISPTSSSQAPSRSSTSITPRGTCGMWPRPSTAPALTWLSSGPSSAATSWTTASSPRCLRHYASTPQPTTRLASASTTSSATATACGTQVPRPGPVHLHWRGRGRLQDGDRDPLQARRHALDRRRGRRDHRAALLQAEQPLRGLLGAAIRSGARRSLGRPVRSSHKSDVRPQATS